MILGGESAEENSGLNHEPELLRKPVLLPALLIVVLVSLDWLFFLSEILISNVLFILPALALSYERLLLQHLVISSIQRWSSSFFIRFFWGGSRNINQNSFWMIFHSQHSHPQYPCLDNPVFILKRRFHQYHPNCTATILISNISSCKTTLSHHLVPECFVKHIFVGEFVGDSLVENSLVRGYLLVC